MAAGEILTHERPALIHRPFKSENEVFVFALLSSWTRHANCQLRSATQLQLIATLNVHGACTAAGADYCPDGRALSAAGDRSNNCTNRSTDRRAFSGLRRLIGVADRAFVVNANYVAFRISNGVDQPGETIATPIA